MRYQYWQDRNKQNKLPIIFKLDDRRHGDDYYLHWHKAVEIVLIESGSVQIQNNEFTFSAKAGEMYIIHSTHLHSYHIGPGGAKYYCLILPCDFLGNLDFFYSDLPYRTTDSECIHLYKKARKLFIEKSLYYKEQVLGLILQLYGRLAAQGGKQAAEDGHTVTATVRKAINYIETHYAEKLNIEGIAASANISRHHLCHIFKEFTGTTLAHYWQAVRCDAAKKLLRQGASVGEAAEQCGFSSYSYFAKVYQKHFGIAPSRYRKEHII